jgi:hypothetical protein
MLRFRTKAREHKIKQNPKCDYPVRRCDMKQRGATMASVYRPSARRYHWTLRDFVRCMSLLLGPSRMLPRHLATTACGGEATAPSEPRTANFDPDRAIPGTLPNGRSRTSSKYASHSQLLSQDSRSTPSNLI